MTLIWILSLWLDGLESETRNKNAISRTQLRPSAQHEVQQTAKGIQMRKAVFLYKSQPEKRLPKTITA